MASQGDHVEQKYCHLRSRIKSFQDCLLVASYGKGRFQKPQSRKLSVKGGGVPPLSVNFFPLGFLEPAVREGGGEYPPFPLRKNPLKIGPKTVFFGQKTPFSAKKILFLVTDRPLTFFR